jgi:hypothetical protein
LHLAKDPVLVKRLENRYQLKVEVTFNKDKGEIELTPPINEWIDDIKALIFYILEELAFIPCFAANEIGSSREDGKVHIFEKDDKFIETNLQTIAD